MITGIHHINLVVPEGTLSEAEAFYGGTLGLTPRPVPAAQVGTLLWYDIADSGQQVHIAFGSAADFEGKARHSRRHPCFRVSELEHLIALRWKIYDHFVKGGVGGPMDADEPGKDNSGSKGAEYPSRFFARDYAGNRLEFTL